MIDINRYKNLDILNDINQKVIDIITEGNILSAEKFDRQHVVVVSSREATSTDWQSILVYHKAKQEQHDLSYVDSRFSEVQALCKQTDSIVTILMNIIGPKSFTPLHTDDLSLEDKDGTYAPGSADTEPTYQILTGVYMPSQQLRDNGLFIGNTAVTWSTKEFLAFDGQTPHWGWNITDEPRISLYVDVTRSSFI